LYPYKYQTNEIVIIDTSDALYGRIRMPAVIRFEHENHPDIYEINALIPTGADAAGPRDMAWWTNREEEIAQSWGMAVIEHGGQPRAPGRWMFIPDDAPKTVEQPYSHRIVME